MTIAKYVYGLITEILATPIVLILAVLGRFAVKPIDVGIGPEPLITAGYHKQALAHYGYSAQTFVHDVYYITDTFDVRGDRSVLGRVKVLRPWLSVYLFGLVVFRYKCLYIYFNGGPLHTRTFFLWRLEPWLLKLAGVKTVVMPYGGDVQDLLRTPNLLFRDAIARDYPKSRLRRPRVAAQIDLWTRHASHIISGCDWVEYMYHWDTLMLAHFAIDLDAWTPYAGRLLDPAAAGAPSGPGNTKFRILHAPNHRTIKGTRFFIQAVEELVREGLEIELVLLERVSNQKVREVMASVDAVADQLVIGWYAMFALEAMAMEKPVLCYLREDFQSFYINAGLIEPGEIPIINCSPATVKEAIRRLAMQDRAEVRALGQRSRAFTARHHSVETVGKVFDTINRSLGIQPRSFSAMRQEKIYDDQHQAEFSR
jgi:glycosyltransferase involved in cell wall biosynthesis